MGLAVAARISCASFYSCALEGFTLESSYDTWTFGLIAMLLHLDSFTVV